ncbi:hypothetical protein AB0D59_45055 [Streptomyces sp. NPDC048417]|uniref:hypothetical protein n=1 Tax=Streptomyces sp. NPDC048417 TaxID=3155387 RepID=UPI003434300A
MSLRNNSRDSSRVRAQRALAHNKQSRVCLVPTLLVLVLTAAMLGSFGIRDLAGAFTFPGRLAGAVLVAVAFTSFLGATALVDHWLWRTFPSSGLVALLGAFAAFVANMLFFFELLSDADSIGYKALFGALTVGSAWAFFAVWRTLAVIPAPKRVATALLATTVVALGNFGYQSLYLPSQREVRPVIKLTARDPVMSPDRKAFSVPVEITLENHGDLSFDVLGTEFHAMGQRVPLSPKDQLRHKWRADAQQWSTLERSNPVSRREMHQPGDLVDAQPWMRYGEPISANDTVTTQVVVQLPKDTPYDQVVFYASAHMTRKDRVSIERLHADGYSWSSSQAPPWLKQQKESDSLIYKSRLHENNAIDERTRDPRYVTVYWQFGLHGANITEIISKEGGKDETQKATEDRYGLRIVDSGPVARTLWDIKGRQ